MMEAKPLSERPDARRIGRKITNLLDASRLHLVRRSLDPEDLQKGDRLRIESGIWQVRGVLLLVSGSWAFLLEPVAGLPAGTRTARLLSPAANAPGKTWIFFREGRPVHLAPERIVVDAAAG